MFGEHLWTIVKTDSSEAFTVHRKNNGFNQKATIFNEIYTKNELFIVKTNVWWTAPNHCKNL